MVGLLGLNTAALGPWNNKAKLPLQRLLTDKSGTEISSKRFASCAAGGSEGSLSWFLPTEAMIWSSAAQAKRTSDGFVTNVGSLTV